jgi:hypothetical protein
MAKCPYSFPARSRAAMADAIESIGHYRAYGYGSERYPFCWNVKLDGLWRSDAATLNAANSEHGLRPAWDSAFESYCEGDSGQGVFERVQVSMWFQAENYSTWPGDDSGQWGFTLAGRSGGWLCLVDSPVGKIAGQSLEELVESIRLTGEGEEWPFANVRTLYRGLVCMDSDFTRDKVNAETRYQLAHVRAEWESERADKIRELWHGAQEDRERARALAIELRGAAGELPPVIESNAKASRRELLKSARRDMGEAWELLGELALADVMESGE